jgi:membrane protein
MMAVGRDVLKAVTPDEVPLHASPWKLGGLTIGDLARRVWAEIGEDEIADRAAALSYYFIFALFPTLLFLTALLGLLPFPRLMDQLMDYLGRVLPPDAVSIVQKTLGEVVRGAGGGLLSVGVLGALWASSNGMTAVITTLNVAYGVTDPRPWWKRKLVALLLTVGFSAFIIVALVLLVFGPKIGETIAGAVGLGRVFTLVWSVAQWPVVGLAALTGLALVYYFAPAMAQKWYWVTPGSLFALVAWLAMSTGLRFYVSNVGNYNVTYGSIGGVILLMLWLYLSGVVLLVGAEVNSEIERAAARRGAPTARAPGERRAPAEAGVPAARPASAARGVSRAPARPYAALYFVGALVVDFLRFVGRLLIGRVLPGRGARQARAPRRAA